MANTISWSVAELAAQTSSNEQLLARVRQLHPDVTVQDIVHSAFRAAVDASYRDGDLGLRIYDFALTARRFGLGAEWQAANAPSRSRLARSARRPRRQS
jgi:hypothetical protein